MTEKEIITALECCIAEGFTCAGCPYDTIDASGAEYDCSYYLRKDTLDLVKNQNMVINQLYRVINDKGQYIEHIKAEKNKLMGANILQSKQVDDLQEEVDRLKAEIKKPVCMPGDTVYFPASGGEAYPATVRKIIYDTSWIAFEEAAIGKQVFLTKEAAERAGAKNGNNSNT